MRTPIIRIAAAVAAVTLLAACSGSADTDIPKGLRVMVPNSPGSGYDLTARSAAKVLDKAEITSRTQVYNLSGAGGTVGLAKLITEAGKGDLAMMMGLGVVGASYTNKTEAKLSATTPIARLIEEPGAILVNKNSPYKTLDELIQAWKADPQKVTVGGGSSPGGPDHLLPMQLAKTVGLSPKDVNYVSYDGAGELLPALLGGKVAFAASGAGEYIGQIEAGQVRVLATSGSARLAKLPEVKTLKEQSVDLEFSNWRGIVAPPGISADQKAVWIKALDELHSSSQWKDELQVNGWTDAYLSGAEFTAFLTDQEKRVSDVLTDLGLVS